MIQTLFMNKDLTAFEEGLAEFFDFANPEEWETLMWQWFKTTIAGNYHEIATADRLKLIESFELLNKMIKKMGIYSQEE